MGLNGTAYMAIQVSDDGSAVLAVDTATGDVTARLDTPWAGRVVATSDAVWVGDIEGLGICSVSRLDPQGLQVRFTVSVPCDSLGAAFAPLDDAIWFLDRTTADADAHGGALRRIDPDTGEIGASIRIPYVNGFLTWSDQAIFWKGNPLDEASEDAILFRLDPGATTLVPLGTGPRPGLYPAREGVWTQVEGAAAFWSGGDQPQQVVPIEGSLTGADATSVFVSTFNGFDSTPELWRYPADGSAAELVGVGVDLETPDGPAMLTFLDNEPFVVRAGLAVKVWTVPTADRERRSLVMRALELP